MPDVPEAGVAGVPPGDLTASVWSEEPSSTTTHSHSASVCVRTLSSVSPMTSARLWVGIKMLVWGIVLLPGSAFSHKTGDKPTGCTSQCSND